MEMKRNTVRALSDCMDLDELQVGAALEREGLQIKSEQSRERSLIRGTSTSSMQGQQGGCIAKVII
jgi:hypothetical protein